MPDPLATSLSCPRYHQDASLEKGAPNPQFGMDESRVFSQIWAMRILTVFLSAALLAFWSATPLSANDAIVSETDLVQVRPSVWAATGFSLPAPDSEAPLLGPNVRRDGARLLRHLKGEVDINGFAGILYDNRDRGHSTLDPDAFPRLAHLKYSEGLVARQFDFGLAGRIFLPAVVLGNSSAAMTGGALRRSLPRLAMTNPFWRAVTPLLYANNHIYVYPEHRDYDAEDFYPINWPYMIVSQGSSGSDRAFLEAVAMTLAAFPADTFAALREARLAAPTIQMILRRNLASVASRENYLSGLAHPPVLDGRRIRTGRMVAHAAGMRPEDIPPLVRLRVTEDSFIAEAGLAGLDERLLDSHAAIGRLWRDYAWEKTLTVTAEDTKVPNDRDVTFAWRILQGDPARIRIEPQGPDGRIARITIAWHDPWSLSTPQKNGSVERRVSRVDIGVFANNGVHDSAPSVISIDFPEHQIRQYADAAGTKRLISIDYDARMRKAYFDPILYWSAPWTDVARYDEAGALLGWDRLAADGETRFVPVGEDRLPPELYQINIRKQQAQTTSPPEK